MKFGRKVLYYLLGVGLGVLMVFFIFGDRDIQCSYFPNDRVLYDLRKKEIQLAESVSSEDTLGLGFALERARVNFKRSETEDLDCNVYYLDLEDYQKTYRMENCDSIATVLEVLPLKP